VFCVPVDNEKGLLEDELSEEGGKTSSRGGIYQLKVLGFGVWGLGGNSLLGRRQKGPRPGA